MKLFTGFESPINLKHILYIKFNNNKIVNIYLISKYKVS